jgi:hypothetical protein
LEFAVLRQSAAPELKKMEGTNGPDPLPQWGNGSEKINKGDFDFESRPHLGILLSLLHCSFHFQFLALSLS